jgi:hypothetical protein
MRACNMTPWNTRPWNTRPWNTMRATGYGAVIGLAAAGFKLLAPWNAAQGGESLHQVAIAKELLGAMLAFALLCGLAAAGRNLIVRRLTGSGVERS